MAEARVFTGTIKEISDGVSEGEGYEYSYIRFDDHPPVYNVTIPQGMKHRLFRICESGRPGEFYFLEMGVIRTAEGQKKDAAMLVAFSTGPEDAVCISGRGGSRSGTATTVAWTGILICVSLGVLSLLTIVGIPIGIWLFRIANAFYQQHSMNQAVGPVLKEMLDSFSQKYPNALLIGDRR